MIEKMKNSPLNLNATSVYNFNEFSLTELLNKFFSKINECVDVSNDSLNFLTWLKGEGLPVEVEKELTLMYENGTITNLIDELGGGLTNLVTENTNQLTNLINTTKEEIENTNTTFQENISNDINNLNRNVEELINKQTINIYVNANGDDSNNGIDISTPFKSIQKAFDYIKEDVKSSLVKKYVVNIGSGIYNELDIVFDTPTVERVIIQGTNVGGTPNIPTTIINGEGGVDYQHGMRINGVGVKVLVKDIKFTNFTGGNNRIGLVGENECDLTTENVHSDNCSWCGIYAFNTVRARIQGGKLTNCRNGFIANSTQCSIGYTEGRGTIISDCVESGIYWSRGSQGHIDYCNISNCGIGIDVSENSRVSTVDNIISNNVIGIRTRNGGVYGEGGQNQIYSNNTTTFSYKSFSGDTNELINANSKIMVAYDRLLKTVSGIGTKDLSTPYTIKANRLFGVGKQLIMDIYASGTMTTGSSVIVKIGDMICSLQIPSAITNAPIKITIELIEVGGGFRMLGILQPNMTNPRINYVSSGFNPSIQNEVKISCDLKGESDVLTIYRTNVYLVG